MVFELNIEEEQRQMILLAIAELALSRPGWDWTLGQIAKRLQGYQMFVEFKRLNEDRIKPTPLARYELPGSQRDH